jgi:hypothetical protein
VRQTRALVVSRDDEDGNASVGDSAEWLERLVRECRDDLRAIEDVTRVHHDVHLACERRLERSGVVREEVVTTPAPVDTWPDGKVEAEVRIGEEEDSDFVEDQSSDLWLMITQRLKPALF